jgi:hypothetical protein
MSGFFFGGRSVGCVHVYVQAKTALSKTRYSYHGEGREVSVVRVVVVGVVVVAPWWGCWLVARG